MELFEQPIQTEADEKIEEDDQLGYTLHAAYRNLDGAISSVTMADNKALIALTFQGAIVAGLVLIAGSLKTALTNQTNVFLSIINDLLLAGFFTCFSIGTIKLFQTISPRLHRGGGPEHPSQLFFWGGIASMPPDVFAARMRELEPEEIQDAVLRVTHSNSIIAMKKFANLRTGFLCLGCQIFFYVGIVLVSVLPSH